MKKRHRASPLARELGRLPLNRYVVFGRFIAEDGEELLSSEFFERAPDSDGCVTEHDKVLVGVSAYTASDLERLTTDMLRSRRLKKDEK